MKLLLCPCLSSSLRLPTERRHRHGEGNRRKGEGIAAMGKEDGVAADEPSGNRGRSPRGRASPVVTCSPVHLGRDSPSGPNPRSSPAHLGLSPRAAQQRSRQAGTRAVGKGEGEGGATHGSSSCATGKGVGQVMLYRAAPLPATGKGGLRAQGGHGGACGFVV